METFFSFLAKRVDDCSSHLCMALKPGAQGQQGIEACCHFVRRVAPYTAAFRINAADWGDEDPRRREALSRVVAAIQEASARAGSLIPLIWELGRRKALSHEIETARETLSPLRAAALELASQAAWPALEPFLANQEKGALVRWRAEEDATAAQVVQQWGRRENIGLTLESCSLAELATLRRRWPQLWFLLPENALHRPEQLGALLQTGSRADGMGLLFDAPRAVFQSPHPAAVAAALRDEMIGALYHSRRARVL